MVSKEAKAIKSYTINNVECSLVAWTSLRKVKQKRLRYWNYRTDQWQAVKQRSPAKKAQVYSCLQSGVAKKWSALTVETQKHSLTFYWLSKKRKTLQHLRKPRHTIDVMNSTWVGLPGLHGDSLPRQSVCLLDVRSLEGRLGFERWVRLSDMTDSPPAANSSLHVLPEQTPSSLSWCIYSLTFHLGFCLYRLRLVCCSLPALCSPISISGPASVQWDPWAPPNCRATRPSSR